jgi:ligand-binding sensor domain-containing protein/signal transduction histidine kinase
LLLRSLNIFRDRHTERHWSFRWFLAGLVVVCFVNTAQALDPNRSTSEYIRDRWGAEQGFPGGPVYAITQTADGYLWLGTEKGLVRFDGLNFQLFSHTNSPLFPAGPVLDLMTDAEGNLWIRPQSRNLLRYRDGIFYDVMPELDSARSGITALCRGTKGEVLFAVRANGIFRYSGGRFEKLLSTAGMSNLRISNLLFLSMAQTGDGKVWMGARDAGLFFMSDGQVSAVTKGLPDRKINSLLAVGDRELWIGTDNGVVRWNGDESTIAGVSDSLDHIQALAMNRDRESNIWIGTPDGLLRLNAGGVSSLVEGDRESNVAVNTIFEDREGNLWIGSTRGIERLRDSAFMTYSAAVDPSSNGDGAVYVDAEGRTWFAPSAGGLYWQKGGQIGHVKNAGLDRDVIYSLTGSRGELWIGRRRGGLTHLRYIDGSFATETYTQAQGLAQNSIYAVNQSRDRTVWAGSLSGGVTRFKDGRFSTYTTANGLASNTVTAILESSDGTMWFATANGLSSLSQDNWRGYGSRDGLPPGSVNCLLEDSGGAIWIGTDNGIASLRSGQVQVPREVPASLHEPILGVAEDRNGWLWVSTSNHVLRVNRDKLQGGVVGEADVREFGLADGLRSVGGVKRHRSVVVDMLGRIWFSTSRGLSVVDPAQVADTSAPAIVHVEEVTADGSGVDLHGAVRIPGARQRVTFSYAGLSLSVPERVRYRYKLDGFDQDWSEPIATREAVYTNLGPGSYRFRVMASNSDGFWNGSESTVQFEIEPVFWQTWWFRLSCVLVVGLAILAFYRLRLHRLMSQLNVRFEERLAERTRIAQDLHDTLLQGFLSASMQLHVANDQLPADAPAKPHVSRVLVLMGQVIEEGRNAVRGLRSNGNGAFNLEEAFSRIRQELANPDQIGFRVIVEGSPRPLHPVIRDEVYRISREALVNAFRHSRANSIEVEVEYLDNRLRILVRDDGCGIDSEVLLTGREDHWGLSGMRERAERIGAQLKVRSRVAAGTEVELSVPGHVAFQTQPSRRRPKWLTGSKQRKAEEREP